MKKSLIVVTFLVLATTGCANQSVSEFKMIGPSMAPTIAENEVMSVEYKATIKRGDIVVFANPLDEKQLLVKRVIGLPLETIKIEKGGITLINEQNPNGISLEEKYLPAKTITDAWTSDLETFVIPKDGYFVLGDNRNASSDSRACFLLSYMDDCVSKKIPFYITKGDIKGVVVKNK